MHALDEARTVCEKYLPGLYAELASMPMLELEKPGNPGLELFHKHGGPALVIPKKYAGLGVSSMEAVQVVRAIGSCAPPVLVAASPCRCVSFHPPSRSSTHAALVDNVAGEVF